MIIVMGAPGAGKSSVLSKVRENLKGWSYVIYGDLMFEIAKKQGIVSDKDEIRKLPLGVQQMIQVKVADALSKIEGKVLLDTHCSINTPEGYLPGLPFNLLEKLKVERFVLIEAPIKQIVDRRKNDTSRHRDDQFVEELAEHEFINRGLLCAYAALKGVPISIIKNEDGKLEKTVEKLTLLLG